MLVVDFCRNVGVFRKNSDNFKIVEIFHNNSFYIAELLLKTTSAITYQKWHQREA